MYLIISLQRNTSSGSGQLFEETPSAEGRQPGKEALPQLCLSATLHERSSFLEKGHGR